MTYRAFVDKLTPGCWRVEAIDHKSEGECYVAIFSGPDAQLRATEYAVWKNRGSRPAAGPPSYSVKQRDISVHIGDRPIGSWVSVNGNGIKASKLQISGDLADDDSKLVIEVPMFCVEVVP